MKNLFSQAIACGHCFNIAPMEIKGSVDDFIEEKDNSMRGYSWEHGQVYSVLKCPACFNVNIIFYDWHSEWEPAEDEDYSISYQMAYPIKEDLPLGLPPNIATTYQAAEKVKHIDVNAYAILMRRLLEQVCLEQGATGNNLAAKLRNLADKGEIPSKLVDVAKGLKDFGNIGAHAGIGELSDKEVPIVKALTKAILEYIYSAPYLADLAERKLNEVKS